MLSVHNKFIISCNDNLFSMVLLTVLIRLDVSNTDYL